MKRKICPEAEFMSPNDVIDYLPLKIYHVVRKGKDGKPWKMEYDNYSDFICVAESEKEARMTHPQTLEDIKKWFDVELPWDGIYHFGGWCSADQVDVKCIGTADKNMKKGVVCASFHAG